MMFYKFWLICIFLLTSYTLNAAEIIVAENLIEQNITPFLECHLDRNDTTFKRYGKEVINFGYLPDTGVWCRFSLKNETDTRQHFLLEYADAVVTNIVLFDLTSGNIATNGYYYDTEWSITPTFEITLQPKEERHYNIFGYSDSSALNMSLKLWNPKAFELQERNYQVLLGLFFGAMGALFVYNFFLFLFTREAMYGAYVFYLGAIIVHQLVYTTFYEILIPLEWRLLIEGELFSSSIIIMMGIAGLVFTQSVLPLQNHPKIAYMYKFMLVATFGYFVLSFYPPFCSMTVSVYLSFSSAAFIVLTGWYLRIIGYRELTFIVIGWTMGLGSLVFMALRNLDIINMFDYISYTAEVGFFVEATLFSVALVSRLKTLENERTKARMFEQESQTKALLLQELHHRVKNNLQLMSAFFSLQIRRSDSVVVVEGLESAQNRIMSMAKAHELFYKNDTIVNVDAKHYFTEVAKHVIELSNKEILLHVKSDLYLPADQAIFCGQIVNELVSNAVKHAFEYKGEITISMYQNSSEMILHVNDNGKGIDVSKTDSNTLGMKLVQTLVVNELKGTFEQTNRNGLQNTIRYPNGALKS